MSTAHVELRLWRQFLAVAEELHFGNAARRLAMTQPPLTQAIAQLERALGVRLFDRTRRSVQLTAAGHALVAEVRDVLARAEALPALARASADGKAGRLRLAFVSTVGFDLLPRWVRAFRERYPGVVLELVESTGDVQLQSFEQGTIDAGFVLHSPGFAPTGFESLRIAQEPLVVALPDQSALASKAVLSLNDLKSEPLVIFPRRILPSLHDAIFAMYHAAGEMPWVAQEAIQMQTIVNLVSAGVGLAWVPESVQQFQRPGVVYRRIASSQSASARRPSSKAASVITGTSVPRCETSLLWKAGGSNPVVARFVALVRDMEARLGV